MMNEEHKGDVTHVPAENVELLDKKVGSVEQPKEEMSEEQLLAMFIKYIPVQVLQPQEVAAFTNAVEGLENLKNEVEAKRIAILEKNQLIEDKLMFFQKSGMVNIDDTEREKSNKSVQQFVGILDQMIAEITRDAESYRGLISQTPPEHVSVMKNDEVETFAEYIATRIGIIKRYIKAVKRDLAVSFSRYSYGFEMQIKRILYIEHVLQRAQQDAELKK